MLKTFYIFIIYSILGWLMEVVIVSTKKRKITDVVFLSALGAQFMDLVLYL